MAVGKGISNLGQPDPRFAPNSTNQRWFPQAPPLPRRPSHPCLPSQPHDHPRPLRRPRTRPSHTRPLHHHCAPSALSPASLLINHGSMAPRPRPRSTPTTTTTPGTTSATPSSPPPFAPVPPDFAISPALIPPCSAPAAFARAAPRQFNIHLHFKRLVFFLVLRRVPQSHQPKAT